MAKVIIPTPLRKFTDNKSSIETNSLSVHDAIRSVSEYYPELKPHLYDEQGNLRKFLRIYVGDQDIRELSNEQTPLDPQTIVSIIPAIAGGKSV
jgi:molybdopterin converting factor small subunit